MCIFYVAALLLLYDVTSKTSFDNTRVSIEFSNIFACIFTESYCIIIKVFNLLFTNVNSVKKIDKNLKCNDRFNSVQNSRP